MSGRVRIQDDADVLRAEIEIALRRGIVVPMPVLVGTTRRCRSSRPSFRRDYGRWRNFRRLSSELGPRLS